MDFPIGFVIISVLQVYLPFLVALIIIGLSIGLQIRSRWDREQPALVDRKIVILSGVVFYLSTTAVWPGTTDVVLMIPGILVARMVPFMGWAILILYAVLPILLQILTLLLAVSGVMATRSLHRKLAAERLASDEVGESKGTMVTRRLFYAGFAILAGSTVLVLLTHILSYVVLW